MRLSGQFQASLFFTKGFQTHKNINQINQSQLTKQKQINTEQQRQQFLALTKTSKSVEIVRFAF